MTERPQVNTVLQNRIKMRRKISWMDGRTDGQTDRGKTVYPHPPLGSGGIIKVLQNKQQDQTSIITHLV